MSHMELLDMNKTTRNLLFVAAATVFFVLLSACGGDSADEQPLVTVTEDVEDTAVVEVAPTYTPVEPTDMPTILPTAVSTATSVPSIQANGNVNVRSGPGTDYDLVGLLSRVWVTNVQRTPTRLMPDERGAMVSSKTSTTRYFIHI